MKTNFTQLMTALSLVLLLLFMTGCPKKPMDPKLPIVNLLENAVEVGPNMAVLYAEVTDDGSAVIRERGFCYGKEGGAMDTLFCEVSSDFFSVELTDLTPLTTYICCAFAGNTAGRGYSSKFSFTTENDTIPKVKTWYVREVTYSTAVASGQVLGSGGQTVEERGICYSKELRPTIDDMHVAAGSGIGSFDCPLTDLSPETQYYARAYAKCTKGVYYGEQVEFETQPLPLEVHTISVSDVTASRVKAEGEVIRDGGSEVTECGFCWSTEHNPTIEGLHLKISVGVGTYGGYFSGLEKGQTHYVRAYAINEEGVTYGDEVEFVPDDPYSSWPGGASPGLFSIGEYRQVRFSQGNLQYHPDDNVWRFAEHQWDFVGGTSLCEGIGDMNIGTVYANGAMCDNAKIEKYYQGWIDLFGWGTSGWNNGNVYYKPYDFASHLYDNYYGPLGDYDLTGDYAQADWGVYNTISNGGSRQWRTPTVDELLYLLTERHTPSGVRFAMAIVAGVRGMVVLPDDWNESNYPLRMVNEFCYYATNTIPTRKWLDVLEPAGAVFMPACGGRLQYTGYDGVYYDWFNNEAFIDCGGWMSSEQYSPYFVCGSYWTSQSVNTVKAYVLKIVAYNMDGAWDGGFITDSDRCKGYAVRLVSDENMNY